MTDLVRALIAAAVLWAGICAAQPAVSSQPLSISDRGEVKRFRGRLGILGGLAMQKTDLALGASYDVLPLLDHPLRLWLTGDFTLGLRSRELTLLPAALVRMPLKLERVPKLETWVHGGLGMNLTFMRGGTALSFPFRLGVGGHYELADKLGLGMQLDAELGPLVAPFADRYAALHFGLVVAYDL